jgi:two-component system NtrC family sensor kinase
MDGLNSSITQGETSAKPRSYSWRPRSIRAKAAISLLLIAALGCVGTVADHFAIRRLDAKIQIIESFYELNQKILETRRYEKNFLLYGTMRDLLNAREYLGKVRAAIDPVKSFLVSTGNSGLLPHEAELNAYAELLQHLTSPGISKERMDSLKEELRHRGQLLTDKVIEMDAMARQRAENDARRYHMFSFSVIAINMMVSLLVAVLLIRWIIGPLDAIREAAAKVMRGELTTIPLEGRIRQSVEGEEVVNTLNRMLDNLSTKQNQLLQSAKLAVIGRVTAGIAHEINNPLNNISLTAEVLLEDLPNLDCAERLGMVRDILVQADRAREVVRHLLDFSRSRKPAHWEPVDLVKLATSSLALLKNQLRINQLQVGTDFPDQPVLVSGNGNQLEQVVVNIILNAIQASPKGGTVQVMVAEDTVKKQAWIGVVDNGPGIPEAMRQQLFEPFFTTKSDGTGLGLSVSYAIIREHNGDIVVNNPEQGGASFRIVLPLPVS